MEFHSPSMAVFLEQVRAHEVIKLPTSLLKILDHGFTSSNGGIFFSQFFSESILKTLEAKSYLDLSGLEFTTNKFHLEDYSDGVNPFNVAFHFMMKFTEKWRIHFPNQLCNACITFQDDANFGRIAVFSFYVDRLGEVVIDVNEIGAFDQPTYFVQVGENAFNG